MKKISFYAYARNYVIKMSGNDEALVDAIIDPSDQDLKLKSMPILYTHLLSSIRNANQKPNVIGDIQKLKTVLFNFDHKAVLKEFKTDHQKLFCEINKKLPVLDGANPRRNTRRSIWPQFCRSTLSGARFLNQFSDTKDYYRWADSLILNDHSSAALPLILSAEIHGFGYALACDFIKESGYTGYGKPDVHVKDILMGLNLCDPDISDYFVQKTLIQLADECDVTPYAFDKVLYLIGSGRFDAIPDGTKMRGKKPDFLAKAVRDKHLWKNPRA